jgi:hypothetical protein
MNSGMVIEWARGVLGLGESRDEDTVTVGPPAPLNTQQITHESFYQTIRRYIENENLLVHNRMMWLLVPESFLLPTFWFAFQRMVESSLDATTRTIDFYRVFCIMLCVVGISLAVICCRAVRRADKAIIVLRRKWDEAVTEPTLNVNMLPPPTGGGRVFDLPKVSHNGDIDYLKYRVPVSFPVALPGFFAIFWTAMLLLLIFPDAAIWISAHLPTLNHG